MTFTLEQIVELLKDVKSDARCAKRPLGVVLVFPDNTFITGENGPPPGSRHVERCSKLETCVRKDSSQGMNMGDCPAMHAERAAIYRAAAEGRVTREAFMYSVGGIPCFDCAVAVVTAGISKFYGTKPIGHYTPNLETYKFELALQVLEDAGVKYIYEPKLAEADMEKNSAPTIHEINLAANGGKNAQNSS